MTAIGSVLLAIMILLVMITVHEFGHYLAGKALKFKINEFAIGFGPKLFRKKTKKSGEAFPSVFFRSVDFALSTGRTPMAKIKIRSTTKLLGSAF